MNIHSIIKSLSIIALILASAAIFYLEWATPETALSLIIGVTAVAGLVTWFIQHIRGAIWH